MISQEFINKEHSLKEEIKKQNLKDSAESRLLKVGIPRPQQPKQKEVKEFPEDVTSIPDGELGMYLGIYEASAAWTDYCISRREIDLLHAKILMKYVEGKLLATVPGKTKAERVEQISSDEFYCSCQLELVELESDIKLLDSSKGALQRYGKTISREISSRAAQLESFPKKRTGFLNTDQEEVFGKG